MSDIFPKMDFAEVEKSVAAFVVQIDEVVGHYGDSIVGFRASVLQMNQAQEKMAQKSPGENFDGKPMVFGLGNWRTPSHSVMHETTQGEFKRRNQDGGPNNIRAAQLLIVLIFSFWEEVHRKSIAAACGHSKDDLRIPILGDLCKIRNDIVHRQGVLSKEKYAKLEVLKFEGLAAECTIRLTPKDVGELLALIRAAMDQLIVNAGGVDPEHRVPKKVKAKS